MDMMEYFKEKAPADQILGYISAPWFSTKPEHKQYFEETFRFFKEAKEKIYGWVSKRAAPKNKSESPILSKIGLSLCSFFLPLKA